MPSLNHPGFSGGSTSHDRKRIELNPEAFVPRRSSQANAAPPPLLSSRYGVGVRIGVGVFLLPFGVGVGVTVGVAVGVSRAVPRGGASGQACNGRARRRRDPTGVGAPRPRTTERGLKHAPVFRFISPQAVGRRTADAYIDNEAASLTMWEAATRLTTDLPAANEVAVAKFWDADDGSRIGHDGECLLIVEPLSRGFLRVRLGR